MALPGTNDFTGRILRIVTTGTIPLANFKVKGGLWMGAAVSAQASIVDEAGREYDFVMPASGDALRIGEMGWISGPATITAMPGGELQLWIQK